MSKRHSLWVFVVFLLAVGASRAQDTSGQDSSAQTAPGQEPANPQQPVPAYGPEGGVPSIAENPPISGIDLPNLEPHGAPLSYLQAGAHFFQSVDSNIQNSLGGSETQSITDALGSLELQRLWRNYDLALDYLGGAAYYNVNGIGWKQIQEMGVIQKISWKRGQLAVRDAFSYQPEGNFGSAYGSTATTGAALSGAGAFFGGSALGELGEVPRIMNVAVADVVENLTPKSAITAAGGYGFVHFLGNAPNSALASSPAFTSFIGSNQITGEVGYDRVLGPHDQGALIFADEKFNFSTGLDFNSQVIQLMWGHRISGRMDFLVSAGPQFLELNGVSGPPVANPNCVPGGATCANPPTPCEPVLVGPFPIYESCPYSDFRISASGRVNMRYQFPKVGLDAGYSHYISSGSGLFAGAETDVAHLTVTRPLSRTWTGFVDIGFSRNSRILPSGCGGSATATGSCGVANAGTYEYAFAGGGLRRTLSRSWRGFVSYQFNDLIFGSGYCVAQTPCNRTSQRQVGTIGVEWTPRPIRLD